MKIMERLLRKLGYVSKANVDSATKMLEALKAVKVHMSEQDVTEDGIDVWVKVNRAIEAGEAK